MAEFKHTGGHAGQAHRRLQFTSMEEGASSSSSSSASSRSSSPRLVSIHPFPAAAARRASAAAPAPTLAGREVSPVTELSLPQALAQAEKARVVLELATTRGGYSPAARAWARQTGRCLDAFLRHARLAEGRAAQGAMETPTRRAALEVELMQLRGELADGHEEIAALLQRFPAELARSPEMKGLAPAQLRRACEQVLADVDHQLALRRDFLATSESHHVFYLPRMLQSKALYWEAARAVLDGLVHDVARGAASDPPLRARQVRRPSQPAPASTPRPARAEGKHGPALVSGPSAAPAPGTPARATPPVTPARAASLVATPARATSLATPARAASLSTPAASNRFTSPTTQLSVSPSQLASPPSPSKLADASPGPSRSSSPSLSRPGSLADMAEGEVEASLATLARRFGTRAGDLSLQAWRADDAGGDLIADPAKVLGLKRKASKAQVASAVREFLDGQQPACFEDALIPEPDFVLACLQGAVARLREASPGLRWPSDAVIEARFRTTVSQQLSRRPNAVVRNPVLLPVSGEKIPGTGRRVQRQLPGVCEQRPAIAATQALEQSYQADGVQGAHCHERSQHKHATNLYLSRFEVAGLALPGQRHGEPLLSLTRHGVHSPLALSRKGLGRDSHGHPLLSDEVLGRAALDLAAEVGDPTLGALQRSVRAGAMRPENAWKEAARHIRADAGKGFLGFRRSSLGAPLIDRLRAAAALRRAREAAEVAMASLPDAVLADIARRAAQGQTPVVRLASVSLMTPDFWRSKVDNDELAMWRDQRKAWADLARAPQAMPLPMLDAEGRVLRDDEGRLVTTRPDGETQRGPVRFQVAALNVPVNEAAHNLPTSGFVRTRADNRAALQTLLGGNLLAWRAWREHPELIGGWVGEALRVETVPGRRNALIDLAMQATHIYMTNQHHSAGNEPYKLVKRLIVLASLLPGTGTLINCKSGKDRTSEAEAQARHLALQMTLGAGRAPEADLVPDPLSQAQLAILHESGGSPQIQWWNTNLPGTKLKGKALMAQYGIQMRGQVLRAFKHRGDPRIGVYGGASKLVAS